MKPRDCQSKKILLIEDNDIDVELVSRICQRRSLDYPIIHAANGLEALEILKRPDAQGLVQPDV